MKQVRTRFAPSPTGFLHIGNLRTALYAYLYAKNKDGKFILRIEDTDRERYVEGSVDVIYKTLTAAGVVWDEGPLVGGPYAPYVQSERKSVYNKYAEELISKGSAYRCFCSKERLEALPMTGEARNYDRHCRNMSEKEATERALKGEKFVIRQKMPLEGKTIYKDMVFGEIEIENKELEDQILIKADGMPTYNFANVIDDHEMDITCVIRGVEYLSSTPKYNLLYDAFGWTRPEYMHLAQIMRDATHKLSKRDGDASFEDLLKKGYLPHAIVNYIALLGWAPKENKEKLSMKEMISMFSISGISRSQSIFDETKLRWLNGQYIKEEKEEDFLEKAKIYLDASKVNGKYDYVKLCKLIQGRIDAFCDIPSLVNFLEEFEEFDNALYVNEKLKTDKDIAKSVLPKIRKELSGIKEWNAVSIHDTLINLAISMEVKNGIIMWPARVAMSGKQSTPGGAVELADLLGKTETLKRIDFSIKQLEG